MELTVGTLVEGKVTGVTKFGAFVALPNGRSGMVHISEVANSFVQDINQHVQEGQTVKVVVIAIDEKGRINLSIKRALPKEESQDQPQQRRPFRKPAPNAAPVPPPAPKTADELFEDKLRLFMQSSEDRISGLKSHHEKRGSRGRRK